MRKAWAVARREYRSNVRSKAFVVGVFLMPVFMTGSILVQYFVEKRGDKSVKKVAVIDRSGRLFGELAKAAQERNANDVFDPETKRQIEPTYELIEIKPEEDHRAQLMDLSEKAMFDQYFAIVEIGDDIFGSSDSQPAGFRYYSNKGTYRDLPEWLSFAISDRVKAMRFAEAGLDMGVVRKALTPVEIERYGLMSRTAAGDIREAEAANAAVSFIKPFLVLMMMFMLLMVAVQPLLHGVLEEKMQRISEVLLGSMRPFELMLGKLMGHAFVAVTLLGIYAAGGYVVALYYGKTDMIDPSLVGWFVAFLVLAIFMYGSMFLAAGSACNELKEAQSLIMPVMFPMIVPMFFIAPILRDPSGSLATALSIFPLTSPMLMTMRKAMEAPVPIWQAPVAIAGCIAVTLLCVWMAGRIFRVGLLMQGKAPRFSQMMKWAVRG